MKFTRAAVGLAASALLASCASGPTVEPAPKVVDRAVYRPYPPLGASQNLLTPPRNELGVRQTVNTGLSLAQTTWNLRSAFNVAALNCREPKYEPILEGYRSFLKDNARVLSAANTELDRDFKSRFGSTYVKVRETYQTQVYNYFALPYTLPAFCDAAMAMSAQVQSVQPGDLQTFSVTALEQLDRVFIDFFDRFDQYRVDLAAWEARYGSAPTAWERTTVQ